ncbi:permease of the major facilitator superfamily [Shewanella sediminis HAW-EB3]|uniref:Bcr/CflA family efflux transporter n=1 Tax=Shewanella sediminis (strain HAW-EB3) TaxID=425104 RepID=A8FSV4_SHESH|nr:Bcr/CflA family efflux MFS transporter [Shewanella sediminis]ABV35927.1 permease of the major facilitator superfamily [Shewanella sediminis HAW-EB3]
MLSIRKTLVQSNIQNVFLAILLASITALAPLGIDTYLPALPLMAIDFGSSVQIIQTSISIFFIGLALGQFLGGALSDNFGRKPILIIGLFGFMCTSTALVWVDQVVYLLALRFLQAMSGGLAMVNSSAIVNDRYVGLERTRMFALTSLIMASAPLIAPAIGSILLHFFQWQAIFIFLSIYAAIILVATLISLKDYSTPTKTTGLKELFTPYKVVLTNIRAWRYLLLSSSATSVMFIFLTNAAFAYMEFFHVSKELFPVLFASNLLAMMILNRASSFLLRWLSPLQLLLTGSMLQFIAVSLFVIGNATGLSLEMMVSLMILAIGSLGLISPNAMSLYMQSFSSAAGSASAMMGIFNFGCGALMGALSSLLIHEDLLPMSLLMWLMAVITVYLSYLANNMQDASH